MSLAVTPSGSVPSKLDAQALGLALHHGLRGEHVLELRRADAEGERAHAAMGAGVAVAADQRRAGQRQAQLGADDVDDAVAVLADVEQADAELLVFSRMHFSSGAPGGKVSAVRPGVVEMA